MKSFLRRINGRSRRQDAEENLHVWHRMIKDYRHEALNFTAHQNFAAAQMMLRMADRYVTKSRRIQKVLYE